MIKGAAAGPAPSPAESLPRIRDHSTIAPMMHTRTSVQPSTAHVFLIAVLAVIVGFASAEEKNPPVLTRPVRVLVTDAAGKPLPGANIHAGVWTEERFPPNSDHTTNEKGEAVFGVPHQVSILRLWASKENHVPLFANFDAREMGGDPVPLEYAFRLEKGTTIGGYVRNEAGAPIAGAKVEVCVESGSSRGLGETSVDRWLAFGKAARVTDERGFWSLHNVPSGDDWKIGLCLQHPDYVSDQKWRGLGDFPPYRFSDLRGQSAEAVMQTGTRISGTIKDAFGKPVEGALVIWGDKAYHNTNVQETFTGKDGRYQTLPLGGVVTTLTIVATGCAPELKSINLEPPVVTADFPLQPGHAVVFNIVDTAGKPIPGATVNVLGWRNMESLFNWRHSNVPYSKIPDKADDKGRYEWTWAPEDAVQFSIWKKGYEGVDQTCGPGAYDITLRKKRP
jgi:hypothetical protein